MSGMMTMKKAIKIIKDRLCVPESPSPLDFRETGVGLNMLYTYHMIIYGIVGLVGGIMPLLE